jgi:hypothetical protein
MIFNESSTAQTPKNQEKAKVRIKKRRTEFFWKGDSFSM